MMMQQIGKTIIPMLFMFISGCSYFSDEYDIRKKRPESSLAEIDVVASLPQEDLLTIDDINIMRKMGVKVAFEGDSNSYEIPKNMTPQKLKTATILNFNGQELHELPVWLNKFTNLKKLDLANAQITFDSLDNIPNAPLEIVNLSNNRLFIEDDYQESQENFMKWFNFLKKIQGVRVLDLSVVRSEKSQFVPANLHFLPHLQSLNLSGNDIGSDITELGLEQLTQLKYLNLSNTSLSDKDVMLYIPVNIMELDLSDNQLKKMNYHGSLPMLKAWHLNGNHDLKIAEEFAGGFITKNLEYLQVDETIQVPQGLVDRLMDNKRKAKEQELNQSNESATNEERYSEPVVSVHRTQWMRCSIGQEFVDNQCQGEPQAYTYAEVKRIINNVNKKGYAGYYNWRLPSNTEMLYIVQCSKTYDVSNQRCYDNSTKPTIDLKKFPNTPAHNKSGYWTSSSSQKGYYRVIYFDTGHGYNTKAENNYKFFVRLARTP